MAQGKVNKPSDVMASVHEAFRSENVQQTLKQLGM
jgi:hypothetical protein